MYADLIVRLHGLEAIGLRYFNVFGARQDPAGPYAAVIPRWIAAMSAGEPCFIFGDGLTSRDFCYVENVVQANILAGVCAQPTAQVFNIAVGKATTLNQLHQLLRDAVAKKSTTKITAPTYAPARAGDIQHSLADITRATKQLGYVPSVTIEQGIELVTQASRLAS